MIEISMALMLISGYALLNIGRPRISIIPRFNISSISFITYTVMIYIPSYFVYNDFATSQRDTYLLGVVLGAVCYCLGVCIYNHIKPATHSIESKYFSGPIGDIYPHKHVKAILLTTLLLLALVIIYYFYSVPTIPIIGLIMGNMSSIELTLAREESFKLLDPRWGDSGTYFFYVYLFARTLIFPLLILITFCMYFLLRDRPSKILFASSLLLGSIFAVSSLSRAPISAIVMRLLVAYLLLRNGKIQRIHILAGIAGMLTFPVIVTGFANLGSDNIYAAISLGLLSVLVRLTYTPAEDLYYYFEIFPDHHGFLFGQTLIKPLLKLFEFDYFYIENYVSNYINPFGIESAHSNAAYISNLYADFGLLGVVFGSLFVGYAVRYMEHQVYKMGKDILSVSLYSFLFYAVWVLNFGSITSVLFVNGVIPSILIILLLKYILTKR